ncbi:MAG: hypothetical protein EXX96DRAFT_534704 [Benjaminiella poitrasii]|nr:MAG: hypothetical protein EXX96DRAFT_534704 [Benjaminiella poitrasii]
MMHTILPVIIIILQKKTMSTIAFPDGKSDGHHIVRGVNIMYYMLYRQVHHDLLHMFQKVLRNEHQLHLLKTALRFLALYPEMVCIVKILPSSRVINQVLQAGCIVSYYNDKDMKNIKLPNRMCVYGTKACNACGVL